MYKKVILSTGEALDEIVPASLNGLDRDSLSDLSWTDPSLGLHDVAWFPVQDWSKSLSKYQRYGVEKLTPDFERKVVIVTREVIDWTQEEIDVHLANERKAQVPDSVTKRQGRQQMIILGVLDQVQTAIDAISDPIQRALMQSYWDDSNYYDRHHPQMIALGGQIGFSEEDLDNAFIAASKL